MESTRAGAAGAHGTGGSAPSHKVLIVEDDAMNLALLEDLCRLAGWETLAARDGEEGFASFLAQKPDLVLLDLMMAQADGFVFLERMALLPRAERRPVVVVSALSDATSRWRAARLGASRYLTKPFSVANLVEVLELARKGALTCPETLAGGRELLVEGLRTVLRGLRQDRSVGVVYVRREGEKEPGGHARLVRAISDFLGQPQLVFRVDQEAGVLLHGPTAHYLVHRIGEMSTYLSELVRERVSLGGVVASRPEPNRAGELEIQARQALARSVETGRPVVLEAPEMVS